MRNLDALPVAVIGAGPVGLAAAAHLLGRGLPVRVYEAGETVGANVRDWGHVRLFSPWKYDTDPAAVELGAVLAGSQPQENVRVLFDPACHPFCLCRADG